LSDKVNIPCPERRQRCVAVLAGFEIQESAAHPAVNLGESGSTPRGSHTMRIEGYA